VSYFNEWLHICELFPIHGMMVFKTTKTTYFNDFEKSQTFSISTFLNLLMVDDSTLK
jgi:hypothetical protein